MSLGVRGACLCGAVRFVIAPPYRWFAHCHCSLCRKHHGSLFGTGLGVARAAFDWLDGATEIVHYRATAAFERPFCRHCGSTVPAVSHDERYWHVPAGLLDADLGARPRTHIFVASRSPLTELDDALPRHDAYPPGFALPTTPSPAPREIGVLTGSCLCGAVVFAASVLPQRVVNCYCSLCRRSRAAAFGSTLLAANDAFRWVRGAERVRSYALPAAATARDGGSAANAGAILRPTARDGGSAANAGAILRPTARDGGSAANAGAICGRQYRTDFCGDCGSLAPSAPLGSPVAMLPAGSIDTPLRPLPAVHLYIASKAPWYEISAAGERFDELPPPERFTELFQ